MNHTMNNDKAYKWWQVSLQTGHFSIQSFYNFHLLPFQHIKMCFSLLFPFLLSLKFHLLFRSLAHHTSVQCVLTSSVNACCNVLLQNSKRETSGYLNFIKNLHVSNAVYFVRFLFHIMITPLSLSSGYCLQFYSVSPKIDPKGLPTSTLWPKKTCKGLLM